MQQHKVTSDGFYYKITIAVIILICVMAVSCCLGSSGIGLRDVITYFTGRGDELSSTTLTIIGKIRVPRTLTATLVGGALAAVGCVMQGLFRNPMADPSVLGISSGAALGASVAIITGLNGVIIFEAFTGAYIGAVAGAVVTWLMVFTIASQNGKYDTSSTLLAGIAISSIMSALITVLMTLHLEQMERVYMWMLGTFSASTPSKTKLLAAVVLVLMPILILISPRIDVLKLGKETAMTLGVDQKKTLALCLGICSCLLAFCVANSGIIGFVGLIIPHIASFFKVTRMRRRLSLSFMTGAIFMVVCDTVCKTVVAPGELAIGAVTSLIGAPYFLFLLMSSRIRGGRERSSV
ncbi:MAG: iron ABC transporter permease [Clostridiales bacterium]|nr:iron ABC transporter permease [Clostridiales bacterium]